MIEYFQENPEILGAILSPVIGFIIASYFQAKVRLFHSPIHSYSYLINQPRLDENGNEVSPHQVVHTTSFTIYNGGRQSATMVDLIFNFKPQHFELAPPRPFDGKTNEDGKYVIRFENLAPNEEVSFEILGINQEVPHLRNVICREGVARTRQIQWQPQFSDSIKLILGLLAIVGIATSGYFLVRIAVGILDLYNLIHST